jgi:flagellar biosynthetic protein FlhB
MSDQGQRTEKATPRRREKAREEGQFAVSRDLVSAIQLAAFVACLVWLGPEWIARWHEQAAAALASATRIELTPRTAVRIARETLWAGFAPLALPGFALLAAAIGSQLGMTRFGLATSRLAPDLKRINGFKRLLESVKQALPLTGQLLLIIVLLFLAIRSLVREHLVEILRLPLTSVHTVSSVTSSVVLSLLWKAVFVFVALGVLDFIRQRRRLEKQLRMSKQEIREEMKESEGNPQVKQRIRRIQRDLARRRMLKDVPKATAVIVNPTHYSVAIRYAVDSPGAPTVVAKGKNYIARRIREIAEDHNVPIVENQPLAQALYKTADVGQEIPAQLYRAVAEILAYIYRLMNGRLPG